MADRTILVLTQDNGGLFRLMYRASALAFDYNASLKLMMVRREGTSCEVAKWLEEAFRCAQYFDAELCVFQDRETLEREMKKLDRRQIKWAVTGGGLDFVRDIHRSLPGVPIMSKYDHKEKEQAVANSAI